MCLTAQHTTLKLSKKVTVGKTQLKVPDTSTVGPSFKKKTILHFLFKTRLSLRTKSRKTERGSSHSYKMNML